MGQQEAKHIFTLTICFFFSLTHLVKKQSIASLALTVTESHKTSMPWMNMSHTIAVFVSGAFLRLGLGVGVPVEVSVVTGFFCLVALPPGTVALSCLVKARS